MARLDYVPDGASLEVDEAYARISAMRRPVLNLYRMLANQPAALGAFLDMSAYVRAGSSLDPGLRELVILATAHGLGQEYELAHHTLVALEAGVDEAKVRAVAGGGSLETLAPAERCAVELAREAARTRTCDERTFSELRPHHSDEAIVDLVLTVGWYHLCAVVLDTFQVEIEGGE